MSRRKQAVACCSEDLGDLESMCLIAVRIGILFSRPIQRSSIVFLLKMATKLLLRLTQKSCLPSRCVC